MEIANDHMVQNLDMYKNYDMTIGDQLTNSLCELHQTWCLLESYGISETAIRQLCQTAANHLKLLHNVHSLPYVSGEYTYKKLLII